MVRAWREGTRCAPNATERAPSQALSYE